MNILQYDALVIGSGAAGYSAAMRISEGGASVAVITEETHCGTSRNTGSDKQTYYKLALAGDTPDSVRGMAKDLFSCGAVDGDTALCEAALSARCFLKLCELGVAFPKNRYGEYVGYKTDHDPYARATSAGPLTSRYMTEVLEKRVDQLKIPIYSGLLAVELLKDANGVCGVLCLHTAEGKFKAFCSPYIVLATGGPAGIYADSVYPACHTGTTSLALEAGASLQNMTEWQYGLASVSPRWNVSGTYMQVLPRLVSIDENGSEREFLSDFFGDPYDALSALFLKGYQWPFDSQKVLCGSSVIDLLVYRETVLKKHKVYLDYTKNPFGLDSVDFKKLSEEAYEYLSHADVCFGTPVERLIKMNFPAYELYKSKGIDLSHQMLQISLCAQHNNGGIAVDLWWQTNVKGLFAVGECAGTHGITRPGGTALNAGQVGALRASEYITAKKKCIDVSTCKTLVSSAVARHKTFVKAVLSNSDTVSERIEKAARRMSDKGGAIRNTDAMIAALSEVREELNTLHACCQVREDSEIYKAYKYKDILLTQEAVLTALIDYAENIGISRGSALICNPNGALREGLDEIFRMRLDGIHASEMIQEIKTSDDGPVIQWRPVRPIPHDADFFENIWRGYRENKNIY